MIIVNGRPIVPYKRRYDAREATLAAQAMAAGHVVYMQDELMRLHVVVDVSAPRMKEKRR